MSVISEAVQGRYRQETETKCLGCGQVIDALNLQPGQVILDLGCGAGVETIQAAMLVGPSGKAVGLDLTDEMLKQAIGRAQSQKLDNVSFVRGDIENLPFSNNTFNAVQSNCVINHAPNKALVFSEIFRVLKPGGRFVIADAVSKLPLPNFIKDDPAEWAACFGGAVTEEEYLNSITRAGFSYIEILHRREYLKNGYDFISLTIQALK